MEEVFVMFWKRDNDSVKLIGLITQNPYWQVTKSVEKKTNSSEDKL